MLCRRAVVVSLWGRPFTACEGGGRAWDGEAMLGGRGGCMGGGDGMRSFLVSAMGGVDAAVWLSGVVGLGGRSGAMREDGGAFEPTWTWE